MFWKTSDFVAFVNIQNELFSKAHGGNFVMWLYKNIVLLFYCIVVNIGQHIVSHKLNDS